jgi:hypothetical protein
MRASERRSGRNRLGAACAAALALAGCNPVPVNVAARRLAPLPVGSIRRIAVLPFTDARPLAEQRSLPGQEPLPEPPADTVTRLMIDAMRRLPTWQIVDPLVRDEAFRRLYGEVRAPTPEEALAVGKLLGVDAVLRGQVTEFQERVGTEIAAEQPARVVFAVELMRVPSGPVLWQAEYAETQRALTDNLWNLGGFLHLGAKWVRASELAAAGADQVAQRLHETLFGEAAATSDAAGSGGR